MKSVKVGYVFTMVTLITLAVVIGIAAFYPAPKRLDYPSYPATSTDFNSPEYKAQQQKYQQDLKDYQDKNKDVEGIRKIWGQNTFSICLVAGVVLMILGLILSRFVPMVGVSMLFAAFVLMFLGPGFVSYYADSTTITLLGSAPKIDLAEYKKLQFGITAAGTVIGGILGFFGLADDRQSSV